MECMTVETWLSILKLDVCQAHVTAVKVVVTPFWFLFWIIHLLF